jgi:hypothetical protein
MTRYILWLCTFFSFSIFSQGLEKSVREISLEEAKKLVLESRNGFETMEKRIGLVSHKVKDIDKTFNPTLSLNNVYGYDNGDKGGGFTPIEKAQGFDSTLEYSQMFSTGTKLRAALGLGYKDAPLSSGISASPLGAAYANYDSKSVVSKIELELSQSLLKSWTMLALQREIIGSAKITPTFKKKILAQALQYEIELLFVNYTHLVSQLAELKKTKQTLTDIRNVTSKLIKIGQADELALAKADYQLLSLDIRLDSLDLEKKLLEKTILLKCDLPSEESYSLRPVLFENKSSFKDSSEALEFAIKNHLDLQEKEALKTPLHKQISFLKEDYKPDINVFVRYTGNAEKKEFSESVSHMLQQKNPKVAIGLNVTFKLGAASYNNEYASKRLEIEILDSEKQDLVRSLSRELELDFSKLENIQKKKKLNQLKTESLNKQLILEKEKFTQARGGKASVLLYDIDKQAVITENLALDKDAEITLSHIKFLTHSY